MAYINLIYCSICTALFTTLGRPGQVGTRGRREEWEEEWRVALSQSGMREKDFKRNQAGKWRKMGAKIK